MLILMLLVGVIVLIGVALVIIFDMWNQELLYYLGTLMWIVGSAALVVMAIGWADTYYMCKEKIAIYQATQQTIEEARKGSVSEVERAALTTKIIAINEELASAKYENEYTIFKDMIPDDYAALPYLK